MQALYHALVSRESSDVPCFFFGRFLSTHKPIVLNLEPSRESEPFPVLQQFLTNSKIFPATCHNVRARRAFRKQHRFFLLALGQFQGVRSSHVQQLVVLVQEVNEHSTSVFFRIQSKMIDSPVSSSNTNIIHHHRKTTSKNFGIDCC